MYYFRENLELMRELNERAAQGRACGNLGNTHYLLGNFQQAIRYHEEVSSMGWDSVLDRIRSWG
jgi:G-protein signaling modulator 2